jgi:hypothetical protein
MLKMLQGSGQAVVQPILESFVEEMGRELSRQFILKLVWYCERSKRQCLLPMYIINDINLEACNE